MESGVPWTMRTAASVKVEKSVPKSNAFRSSSSLSRLAARSNEAALPSAELRCSSSSPSSSSSPGNAGFSFSRPAVYQRSEYPRWLAQARLFFDTIPSLHLEASESQCTPFPAAYLTPHPPLHSRPVPRPEEGPSRQPRRRSPSLRRDERGKRQSPR